jgi:hypothetical protein
VCQMLPVSLDCPFLISPLIHVMYVYIVHCIVWLYVSRFKSY